MKWKWVFLIFGNVNLQSNALNRSNYVSNFTRENRVLINHLIKEPWVELVFCMVAQSWNWLKIDLLVCSKLIIGNLLLDYILHFYCSFSLFISIYKIKNYSSYSIRLFQFENHSFSVTKKRWHSLNISRVEDPGPSILTWLSWIRNSEWLFLINACYLF